MEVGEDKTWRVEGLYRSNMLRLAEGINTVAASRLNRILTLERVGFGLMLGGGITLPFSRIASGILGLTGMGLITYSGLKKLAIWRRVNAFTRRYDERFQKKHDLDGPDLLKMKRRAIKTLG